MEDKIYIFGHKNPDTDSICAAITLSYLYNAIGYDTEPRTLSNINEETKYVLKKLKIEVPKLLDDVKLQVSDINYHKDFTINIKDSVYKAFFKMQDNNMSTIPLVDNNGKFIGAFAMKDIAKQEILGNIKSLKASYDDIVSTINGTQVLKFNEEIDGNIINVALRSTTFNHSPLLDEKSILIIGDRHSIIEEAVHKKIKLIVATTGCEIKDDFLEIAKNNKVNVIYTKNNSLDTLIKIGFASHIEDYRYTKDLICAKEDMEVSELNDIINKTKHSYYPVLDHYNRCLGLIKLSDLSETKPKKIILVDHNEISQSVQGIEEAEIVGVVDHHKLGTLGTSQPINFRNMTVGSTCTIIYQLYKENKVKIPEHIAALLIAGIVSDTLLLKSPTTTNIDKTTLNELSKLVKFSPDKFAMEMFKANDTLRSKSLKEIVYTDLKTFEIGNRKIAISQITTLNAKAILKQKTSYIRFLNKESNLHGYEVMILVITDIFKNGSYLLFNQTASNIIKNGFGDKVEEGSFIEGVVSRKKQIIPVIMNVIK